MIFSVRPSLIVNPIWRLINFPNMNSFCLKVQTRMDLLGMSSIWKRSAVGQMCQNSCLQIFESFVLWVVECLVLLIDTRHILAKPPFAFRTLLLLDSVGNHWYRKLGLFLIHVLCIFVWLLDEIIPLKQPETHFPVDIGKCEIGACPGSV